jgi:hypothetical protein
MTMNELWNEFLENDRMQSMLAIGGCLAFFCFAKYMEIRQDKKDAERRKKKKINNLKRKKDDELEKLPPYFM